MTGEIMNSDYKTENGGFGVQTSIPGGRGCLREAYIRWVSDDNYSRFYVACFALDIKSYEKYFGAEEAENILKYMSEMLSKPFQTECCTAKIYNGAFAWLFSADSDDMACRTVENRVRELNCRGGKGLNKYHAHFNAGIYHLDSPDVTMETALYNAVQACRRARKLKTPCALCDQGLLKKLALKKRLQPELTRAVLNHEFHIYLQFIYDVRSAHICGAEALTRWHNEENGILLPEHYVEELTASGYVDELDFYCLESVCRILESWEHTACSKLTLSCNFSRSTVSDADFLRRFREVIDRFSFEPSRLIIELTEDMLTENYDAACRNIKGCRDLGCNIAIDDFGSGYTSFMDLCDFPAEYIKIDKEFGKKALNTRGRALLDGLTDTAHRLGVSVLYEGVESADEAELVGELGADYIQGFFYSPVVPAENALEYYESSKFRV
ncbi:MAG: EAL domain-containing protein [Candidatus Limivicinus sp.]|jgi:EAL domain-containing protein (putative c-di-GMP-specific phosphodiesterase class I)